MAHISTQNTEPESVDRLRRRVHKENMIRVIGFGTLLAITCAGTALAAAAAQDALKSRAEPEVCIYTVPRGFSLSRFAYMTSATIDELRYLNQMADRATQLQEGQEFKAPCSDQLEPYLTDKE